MIFWYPYSNPPNILFHPYKLGGLQALEPLDVEVQALAAMQDDARDEPHREVMEEIPRDGIWLRVNLQNLARLCDFQLDFHPNWTKLDWTNNTWQTRGFIYAKWGTKLCRPLFFFLASPAQPGPWDDIPIKYVCLIFRHTLHHPTMGIENQPLVSQPWL